MKPEFSIIAPLYNEKDNIFEFIARINETVKETVKEFEIIFVDDGSSDGTWSEVEKFAQRQKNIKAIKFTRNFGHHYAISAGLEVAEGLWTVVMDSDLQDRPEAIPELLKEAKKGFDVVFVNRIARKDSRIYLALQKIFYFCLNMLSGIKFDSRQGNFSIISYKVVDAYNKIPENARFYVSTIKWLGFKSSSIDFNHDQRFSGKPGYSISKRISLAVDIIISFSNRPLKISILLGAFFSTTSFFLFLVIVENAIAKKYIVSGWASLIASILFSTGIILIVLGTIGIYIGRIFNEVKRRPLYINEKTLNL